MTPLADVVAVENSSLQFLEMLLYAGASTEVKNRRGRVPLTHAIFENKETVVQLLLEKGAKPQLCNFWPSFDRLLHFTMTVSSLAVLKALLDYFEKVIKSTKGSLPKHIPTTTEALQSAIRYGKFARLKIVIGIWKAFDDTIYDGQDEVGTVLQYAAKCGPVASMEWLWAQATIATEVNKVAG